MTSPQSSESRLDQSNLGTISVMAWAGEHVDDGRDMAFLLAYSLGDGAAGPEAAEEAVRHLLTQSGLPIGGGVVDGSRSSLPMTVLVEDGSASLSTPYLNARCLVPEQWTTAARKRDHVYFMFTTRPWPQGAPGVAVAEEDLKAFLCDEATISASAHCLLPVSTPRT
ncbi:hypothetical protein J7I98_38665 [Streptomyces sp. ISL-98]|uniref:DUF5949 family protein n=1 Tax=Streptomyces sp. ISL-98 TaxID=2819192 RepID=UPI001BEA2B36|nr:DUF5949 family protein [Streptomyces sp. ISL-98]MBT2511603.1 hypothetical protein [Streptomyces sp. ISL-98]